MLIEDRIAEEIQKTSKEKCLLEKIVTHHKNVVRKIMTVIFNT